MSLAQFQDAFANAILAEEVTDELLNAIPDFSRSAIKAEQFKIYREIALTNLHGILSSVFPTVARQIAEEDFLRISTNFFLQHPPQSINPVIITEQFANYLENSIKDKPDNFLDQEYLPDLATLDYGCYQSLHAIDASAVNTRIFTDLSPEQLSTRRIQLHPACFWLSSAYAIYDIWQQHNSALPTDKVNLKLQQEVVIIRPTIQVEVHRVDVGLVKTLDALDEGETLNDALMQGSMADPLFNAVGAMQFLIQNDLIISLY